MRVARLIVGMVQTNCYMFMNEETNEGFVVDPGDSAKHIIAQIDKMGMKPMGILLTHGHFDHILAAPELKKYYNIPIYATEIESALLQDPTLNLSVQIQGGGAGIKADKLLKDGEKFELAGFEIETMVTPGHTKGSCCYYIQKEDVLISGDTLFEGSYGRTDFPGGSTREMADSCVRLLTTLPEKTNVLPGHSGLTTIGDEKRWNPMAAYIPKK